MLVSVASVVDFIAVEVSVCVSRVKIFEMEQCAMIKFYFKLGKTATEVSHDLKNVYDDDCLSHAPVLRWFTHFQEGRESEDDLIQTGQFLLGAMKMWRKLMPL
jgi:hypothetical protein